MLRKSSACCSPKTLASSSLAFCCGSTGHGHPGIEAEPQTGGRVQQQATVIKKQSYDIRNVTTLWTEKCE